MAYGLIELSVRTEQSHEDARVLSYVVGKLTLDVFRTTILLSVSATNS